MVSTISLKTSTNSPALKQCRPFCRRKRRPLGNRQYLAALRAVELSARAIEENRALSFAVFLTLISVMFPVFPHRSADLEARAGTKVHQRVERPRFSGGKTASCIRITHNMFIAVKPLKVAREFDAVLSEMVLDKPPRCCPRLFRRRRINRSGVKGQPPLAVLSAISCRQEMASQPRLEWQRGY